MNERIKELAKKAGLESFYVEYSPWQVEFEKFTELLVRECAVYCEGHILPKGMAEENDLNYNEGVMDCAIGLKLHFGIKV